MKRIIFIIVFILVSASGVFATVCNGVTKFDEKERLDCVSQGGKVLGDCCGEICILPSHDGGKICTAQQDCQGLCLGDTKIVPSCSNSSDICKCSLWQDKAIAKMRVKWNDDLGPILGCK